MEMKYILLFEITIAWFAPPVSLLSEKAVEHEVGSENPRVFDEPPVENIFCSGYNYNYFYEITISFI